jgi:hypothetical protein
LFGRRLFFPILTDLHDLGKLLAPAASRGTMEYLMDRKEVTAMDANETISHMMLALFETLRLQ